MKNILVLGCSCSEGDELYDEFLIDNYWNFLNEDYDNNDLFNRYKEHNILIDKRLKEKNLSRDFYKNKCLSLSWPSLLSKKDNLNIINYATSGSGISFFRSIYGMSNNDINYYFKNNKDIIFKNDLKNLLETSDILIWQLTNEPRIFNLVDNDFIYYVSYTFIKDILSNKYSTLPKWKKKIIVDYYENIFDENNHLNEVINFFEMILYKRILAKKHTIIFSFFETNFYKVNYKPIENEYIHYLNDISSESSGYLFDLIRKKEIQKDEATLKFFHPSIKAHKLISKKIYDFMIKEGLI